MSKAAGEQEASRQVELVRKQNRLLSQVTASDGYQNRLAGLREASPLISDGTWVRNGPRLVVTKSEGFPFTQVHSIFGTLKRRRCREVDLYGVAGNFAGNGNELRYSKYTQDVLIGGKNDAFE